MAEMDFTPSPELTIGVELELQLVQSHDYDLARDAAELLARLEKVPLAGAVKPEITESMIELNTSVHRRHAALAAELEATRDAVVKEAGMLNLRVCGGGAHPFHSWSARRIFPTERFKHILERYGYLAKQFTVFGQHIHVGCPSGDDAVYLVHMMTRYVPHFIALSAASPFYQGEDTSFQSSRLTAVNAFPLAGHMPFVKDWAEFLEYYERMRAFGVVESMKDFYWDIRPKPEYGTIEIRVCDTPLTVGRAAALAAYAQALARWLLDERPQPAKRAVYLVNAFNRFEAARFGLRGQIIDPFAEKKRPLADDVLDAIAGVMPQAAALGGADALAALAADVRSAYSDADWLRERFAANKSLAHTVRESAARWAGDKPRASG
ncbi:MAG: YbdK family carboxylate-amine ligase [Betaproteobacteria bacterium]|nr:YbdK family carboxylate-amine ligase [Betaproteobacteria bacterium]MDH5219902.1 YbdK family carboxylate-amine ligase [Betaproteobacteria bacterium]MDH5349598.1 YbdK family carboxylate-amine ligase [Betaproteobacteria bacterium]